MAETTQTLHFENFDSSRKVRHVYEALGQLAVKEMIGESEIVIYLAADPGYPGNFTRDALTSSFLLGDKEMLEHQIAYSAHYQGTKHDPLTGEEPGKIHHELLSNNGVVRGQIIRELSSAYNACDTTAQFLQGLAYLAELEGPQILERYSNNIERAVDYITSHVINDIFYEMPLHGEAGKNFGLKVTYWKDSRLNVRDIEEPLYPIAYSLAHFQNATALKKIGESLSNTDLAMLGNNMIGTAINRFWNKDHFLVAIDGIGDNARIIDPPSSDSLHALLYISPEMLPVGYSKAIEGYMRELETEAGYRTGLPRQNEDIYHASYIWTHEQALLHAAAQLHGLEEAKRISKKVLDYYNGIYPELLDAEMHTPNGNSLQLWAIAGAAYLQDPEMSFYSRSNKC